MNEISKKMRGIVWGLPNPLKDPDFADGISAPTDTAICRARNMSWLLFSTILGILCLRLAVLKKMNIINQVNPGPHFEVCTSYGVNHEYLSKPRKEFSTSV